MMGASNTLNSAIEVKTTCTPVSIYFSLCCEIMQWLGSGMGHRQKRCMPSQDCCWLQEKGKKRM